MVMHNICYVQLEGGMIVGICRFGKQLIFIARIYLCEDISRGLKIKLKL